MRITLLVFSILLIFLVVALAVFIEPKSGNVAGQGWTIPFWPFVLVIAIALNPFIHDLFKLWLRTRVEIARAENHMPEQDLPAGDEAQKKGKPSPPAEPPPPVETA